MCQQVARISIPIMLMSANNIELVKRERSEAAIDNRAVKINQVLLSGKGFAPIINRLRQFKEIASLTALSDCTFVVFAKRKVSFETIIGKGYGRPSEDPTKLGRAGVNSVRVRVRFIELEQQAAIRHNSIISFFRAFLPSSPRYDGTRRPRDTQAPHVYQPAAAEDSPPHPSRREDCLSFSLSLVKSLVSLILAKSRIPNPKSQTSPERSAVHASGIFFGRLRLEGSLLKTLQLVGCRRCRTKTGITILAALVGDTSVGAHTCRYVVFEYYTGFPGVSLVRVR